VGWGREGQGVEVEEEEVEGAVGRWVDGAREEEVISEMKEGPSKHISKHMKSPWIRTMMFILLDLE
jgi:hypothetical protein